MAQFAIEHLSEDRLAEAWPVVRQSHSRANSDWWILEAATLIEHGGGVLAARGPDGSIHGVATYRVARKALVGRVLAVDTLITFELSRRVPARHALCDALDLLASAFDCRSIVLPNSFKGHARHPIKALDGLADSGPQPDPA